MGKASKKKRQQKLQAESILNGKSLISRETSSEWSLFNRPIIHFSLIAIIGFLVYSNTFHVPFHFDDTPNIVENYKLRDLSNFWPPSGSRWFGFLTFALNYYLGGLNTIGYHVVNLLIHIFNAILVYLLVILTFKTPFLNVIARKSQRLTKQSLHFEIASPSARNDTPERYSRYISLFSALLFVAHPIQTQAVTYTVQRFTSLATMFYLLALITYIKSRLSISHAKRYTLYAVSLISAILAMKTKEISFTLPVIIALYEFMFFEGKIKKRILYLIPMLLTMLIIPLNLIGVDKPIGDAIGELREVSQETEEIPRWSYLLTQFRVIVTYIRLLFFPINQNLDYDYSLAHSFFETKTFLSFIFLLSIFVLAIYLFRWSRRTDNGYSPLISFGILWFFIALSVESSIIPIRDVINEHRLYLPVIGIIIVFVSAVFYILQAIIQNPKHSLAACYLLLAAVIVLSTAAYQRNIIWQDSVSLWEDVVKKSPNKARGYNNLGLAFQSNNLIEKAIKYYQIALKLKPNLAEAYSNLGMAFKSKDLIDKAIEYYQIALKLKPDMPKTHNNLGNAYHSNGWTEKAIEHYQIALKLKPDYAEAYNNFGNLYTLKGQTDKAIEYFQIALKLKPDYADAYNNLANAYYSKGWIDKAIDSYQNALRLKSNLTEAHNNLGSAYGSKGLNNKAIEHFQIALKLRPDYAEAHYNLGVIYMRKGLKNEAIIEFKMALKIKPDYAKARHLLESLLSKD